MLPIKPSVSKDPSFHETLITVFQNHINHIPDKILYRFLENGEEESDSRTFKELYDNAIKIASHVLEYVNPGDRVLLLYPSGLDFTDAFFGCMLAGVIAVPAFPPQGKRRIGRLEKIVSDCNANLIMTTEDIYNKSNSWFDNEVFAKVQWLKTDTLDTCIDKIFPLVQEEDIAFLQYTSGSTGDPKGVMVAHSNIIHNSKLIQNCNHHTPQTIGVSWLPIYHDMGLIGNILQSFYVGFEMIIMPPTAFVQKPVRWLKTISKYKATLSGGPNFAYDLCVNQVKKEDVIGVDLSSWLIAYNGSEPIRTETMGDFADSFEHLGFQRTSLTPCYGMAETTLIVSSCVFKKVPEILQLDKTNFNSGKVTLLGKQASESEVIEFVGNGPVLEDLEVIIVNPDTKQVCEANTVGEIWISGPSVTKGYWNQKELSEEIFSAYAHYIEDEVKKEKGPYLRTGDMGFLTNGQLYISGRLKEMMIINGVNYFPQDIEQTVQQSHPDLQPNAGAVFSVLVKEQQELVIIQEIKRTSIRSYDFEEIKNSIRNALFEMYDLPLLSIVLISPGRVSKTSSGKIQRLAAKSSYESRSLDGILEKWTKGTSISVKETQNQNIVPKETLDIEGEIDLSVIKWLTLLISEELQISIDKINKEASFSGLGLSSLQSIRISGKISDHYKIEVSPTILFEYPTLLECAAHLTSVLSLNKFSKRDEMSIKPITISQSDKIPVSYAQESLWFIDQTYGSTDYHLHRAIKLSGVPDMDSVKKTLEILMDRHKIFCSMVKADNNGVLYQQIPEDYILNINHIKLKENQNIEQEIEKLTKVPFNLSSDLKIRVSLLETHKKEFILLFVIHHIAADGLSEPVFFSEFFSCYKTIIEGKTPDFGVAPIQYADYAIWQRSPLQETLLNEKLKYWTSQLQNVTPINIPQDFLLTGNPNNKGKKVSLVLDKDLKESLVRLSKNENVTLYMTMLAACKVLLYKYSGQPDICIGSPIANRTQTEVFNIIGMFVNTLALRSNLSGNPSFKKLLNTIKQVTIDAYTNQSVPFEKIVEKLSPDREVGKNPLFQIMFDFQDHFNINEFQLGDIKLSEYLTNQTSSMFDLTFALRDIPEGLLLSIEYSTSLFNKPTIDRMLFHYRSLLISIIKDADLSLDSLSMLTNEEEDLILGRKDSTEGFCFNPGAVDLNNSMPVNVRFESIVEQNAEAPALIHKDVLWSYTDLNKYSNQIAHGLLKLGVRLQSSVGVYLDRSVEFVGCMLGILKSGCVYTPLDTNNPPSRILKMLENSPFSILITTTVLLERLGELKNLFVIVIDDFSPLLSSGYGDRGVSVYDRTFINSMPFDNPDNRNSMDSWAYVLYTSGSTGDPKGAITRHDGAMNHILAEYQVMELKDGFRFLQSAGIGSDISVWQFLGPLLKGGAAVIVDKFDLLEYGRMLDILVDTKVNLVEFVPTYMWGLLSYIKEQESPVVLKDLTTIMLVGESIPVSMVNELKRLYPSVRLWNAYGPCEASDDVIQYEIKDLLPEFQSRVPIGRVIPNMNVVVLDKSGKLSPIGVIGELCVSGVGVGAGYLGLPDRTSQSFIPNPFSELLGDVLYKTGDLGRWLPDGNLEFIGREDHQVKIRGHRVELEDIASVLRKDTHIEDCHVLLYKDDRGQDLVLCFVVLSSSGLTYNLSSSVTDIFHSHCSKDLPSYMHPSHYYLVDKFPLNLSDKVDSKQLLELFLSDYQEGTTMAGHEYVEPRNETEEHLVIIWQELLRVEKVSVYDNFFELGGHSLLATRLVSMIRKELAVEIAIKDIFVHARLSDLAVHISKQKSGILLPAIAPQKKPEHIPLSYSQERLWFLDQLEGTVAYHMPVVLSLEGALDMDVLEQSFKEIISRHEVLRTIIYSEKGVGYQKVISVDNWRLEKDIIEDEKNIEEKISSFIKTPFDLSKDYKFRVCIYDLGTKGYLLAGVLHHIASDGWSEGIFVNEFKELYSAIYKGHTPVLTELSLQYSDYAIWQREYIKGEVLENELSYWNQKLKGVAPLILPTDYARPPVQSTKGATIDFKLDKRLGEALETLCQKEGVTMFMMLLSAFKVLLYKYSNQEDICVGSPIANRTQTELEGIIGFFVNTLALRTNVSGNLSFKELLLQVKKTTLEGYDHQLAPFEKVVDRVADIRDMSITPLFQVLFVLQNTPEIHDEMLEMEDVSITNYGFDNTTSKFDLTLNVLEKKTGILLTMEYCTALFGRTTIEQMLIHYQELLINITKNIEAPVHTLSIITKQEHDKLLYGFNNSTCGYPKNKTIVDLFTEQAQKTPEAIAVVCEGKEMTYKDLDERSNQLGHYLVHKGIQPEELTGICIHRSLDMITGILGILKAGGAYVPIDPDYPQNRIDYMIEDSGINLVLSSSDLAHVFEETTNRSIVLLDEEWKHITRESIHPVNRVSNPNDLAYVIYTSGSTGKPKGVLITNINVIRLFEHESLLYDFNSDDVWTLFHSFCFDFSVWEMYGALFYGGRLVIVPKTVTKDTISFKKLLIEEGVTVLNQTPGAFYVLQEELLQEDIQTSLRYVIFGGEALNPSYLYRWKQTYPTCKLVNMYGITETTVHVTYKEITEEDTLSSTSTIGSAIPTLSCYILDEYLNLVPVGVVGELCIGGAGVARGYLNREELTSERFIPDPFSIEKGARLYKSGDLGKWLPNGTIEYIGRKDAQVKIRGYRIELGEIENVLSLLESVKQCCVLVKEDINKNKRLVAYAIVEGDFDKQKIQDELGQKLPDYMVPQIWVVLDEMPLTNNGKIDKKALPEPNTNQLSAQQYVAPSTKTEKLLAQIWKELLGLEKVGIYDNFFEVGGDSIISIRLISKINESFNLQTQIQDLFRYSTIKSFSDAVLYDDQHNKTFQLLYETVETEISKLGSAIKNETEPLYAIEDVYPMSDVQQGMVLESLIDPSLAVFHDQMVFPVKDLSFDINLFKDAIALMIKKHSIFRTRFNLSDYSQPVQIVYKILPVEVLFEDLSSLDQPEQEKTIEDYLDSERKIPFDIKEGMLYRFKVLTIDSSNLLFIYQFHHAIMDGWSVASFITELYRTYFELKKDVGYVPSPILCGQREYILRELVAKKDMDAISFWKEKLSGYKYLDIFSDTNQPTQYYSKQYDLPYLKSIQTQCKKYRISLKSLFFGAYVYALKMLTHEEELTVGLVGNNRPQILDGDKMLGCFLNTLPVRYKAQSEKNWLSYFEGITKILNEINLYSHLTFFEIKRHLGLHKEDLVFDALFNFIDFHVYNEIFEKDASPDSLLRGEGDKKALKVASFERTNSSLNLTVNLTGGRGAEFSYELHNSFKSGISLEHFHTFIDNVLNCFFNNVEEPINNTALFPHSEQQKLLQGFNGAQVDYPKDKTVVDLFRKQVEETPDNVAVVFGEKRLTYKELDDFSNQLANYLLSNHDLNKEDLIGVILDRSAELIISLLAILKTGCAYVPVDPDYPEDRQEYIKKDSDCAIVIDFSFLEIFKKNKANVSCDFPGIDIEPNNLAYVIYTSGSTGKPKGVLVEHNSLVHLCFWHRDAYKITPQSKSTLFSSVGFDASVWEIYPYLLFGGSLYPVYEELRYDLDQLPKFLNDHKITHSYIPTALCHSFIDQEMSLPYTTVLTGGDALHISKQTDIIVYNNYGPTETTVVATYYKVSNVDRGKICIGSPIANTNIYILNTQNDLLPTGVVGELCIGGSGLARGYLNQEKLTKEKFIAHPFIKGERLYKTGDLACWKPNGTIEFIGRKDNQVKIRGYRIELGEIENVLSAIPGVKSCCVLASDNVKGNKRLVGYVVIEGGLDKEKLQKTLKLSLPEYMVPQLWIELDEMPLTSNGKIDKKSLPEPDDSQLSTQKYVAPRNDIEEQLVVIWQELLGIDKIGVHDNFFDLGGHSLLVTRLVSIIRDRMKIELQIRNVFEFHTIEELSSYIAYKKLGLDKDKEKYSITIEL